MSTPFQWPLKPSLRGLDQDGVHFTADFIATAEGILFLEGGPPHELGAHPCCFREAGSPAWRWRTGTADGEKQGAGKAIGGEKRPPSTAPGQKRSLIYARKVFLFF